MKVIIKNGKINGKPIIKAWESLHGWYWFATEKAEERKVSEGSGSIINGKAVDDTIWFGFVVGLCPEWGYFSEGELRENSPFVWEVKRQDIPFIDMEVRA